LWWIFGASFFIIALPCAILLKPKKGEPETRRVPEGIKKCPNCADGGDIFFYESGIKVPGDGPQTRNGSIQKGWVVVSFDDTLERFLINGNAFDGSNVLTEPLVARF